MPLRVLLVNDSEDGLFLLHRAAARELPEATFYECTGATAALTLLESQPVDAIITDNRMPDMSGVAMVERIREHDARTRVMMITGSAEVEAQAMAAGVNIYVAGGSWEDIRAKIRELVETGGGSGE